jgi:hypothetical protein
MTVERRRVWIVALALELALGAGLALAGCSGSDSGPAPDQADPTTQVRSLWDDRTAYVGNASKVTALLRDAGFARGGAYTVSLQTRRPPYAITVSYGDASSMPSDADVERSVTMLLGMVQNLDMVRVVSDGAARSWSAVDVSQRLGYDVKELGRDQSKLTTFVSSIPS